MSMANTPLNRNTPTLNEEVGGKVLCREVLLSQQLVCQRLWTWQVSTRAKKHTKQLEVCLLLVVKSNSNRKRSPDSTAVEGIH